MLQLHSIEQQGKEYYFITYNSKLVQLEPTYSLTEYSLEHVPELMIFNKIGEFFIPYKQDIYSYYNSLSKKIPSSINNISIEDLGIG